MAETVAALAWLRACRDATLLRMSKRSNGMKPITTFMLGILVCGCSSNAADPPADPDGGTSSTASACVMNELASAGGSACATCIQSNCEPTLQEFQDSCGTFFSCACPGGTYESSRSPGCQAGMTTDCTNAGMAITSCETSVCASSCVMSTNPFGGVDAGSDAGASTVPFACTLGSGSAAMCTVTQVDPGTLPKEQQTCADALGQSGSACATAGLAGCCTYAGGSKSCYYDPSQLSGDQASCASGSGTWSSTP
jgi:hypothetical protein